VKLSKRLYGLPVLSKRFDLNSPDSSETSFVSEQQTQPDLLAQDQTTGVDPSDPALGSESATSNSPGATEKTTFSKEEVLQALRIQEQFFQQALIQQQQETPDALDGSTGAPNTPDTSDGWIEERGVDYVKKHNPGVNISIALFISVPECKQKCMENPTCHAFSWKTDDRRVVG
jgi:hypothetical protein